MWTVFRATAVAAGIVCGLSAHASSLQVAPVSLDVPAPGATGVVSLRNEGATPISAQVRVYRWSQIDGVEHLEPANEVAASPPIVTLQPRSNYTVRVVRLTALAGAEQAYRLLIDELPDPNRQRNGQITLLVRYSIPVFFSAPDASPPHLTWSVATQGGRVVAVARNAGGRRLRISGLRVKSGGQTYSYGDGLAGYVLAGSTMRFVSPQRAKGLSGGSASVSATTDLGQLDAAASIRR